MTFGFETKAYVMHEVIRAAMLVNETTNHRVRVEYSGISDFCTVLIYKNGYEYGKMPTIQISVDMNDERFMEETFNAVMDQFKKLQATGKKEEAGDK